MSRNRKKSVVIPEGVKIYYQRDEERHPIVTVAVTRNKETELVLFVLKRIFPPLRIRGKHWHLIY